MAGIVNAANTSVAASPTGFVVTKTGGDPALPDASAVSGTAIAGDFVLRVRPLGIALCYFGVSANPLTGNGYTTIDRAVQINGTSARCYESGIFRPPLFTLGAGYVWLRRTGDVLEYLNGADLATANLVRSAAGVSGPLWFDSSIVRPDVGLEVRFETPDAFAVKRVRRRLSLVLSF